MKHANCILTLKANLQLIISQAFYWSLMKVVVEELAADCCFRNVTSLRKMLFLPSSVLWLTTTQTSRLYQENFESRYHRKFLGYQNFTWHML